MVNMSDLSKDEAAASNVVAATGRSREEDVVVVYEGERMLKG